MSVQPDHASVDRSLADLSDDQLRVFAEQVVAVGRAAWCANDPTILATPAAAQIAEELAILTAARARQRRVQQAIAALERLNRPAEA